MKVTALLVCHNGGRWLPAVVEGLQASTVRPDRTVVVDTGSTDDSVAIVERALGERATVLDPDTGYPDAVRAGLAALPPAEDPDEWVWLLHDDARPAPGCLAALCDLAATAPAELAAIGPKLREWPSLKRLLEVGVTISGTGKRETGLEAGEYDQGQYDETGRVLAVNTAGMLVRRSVLTDLGLDPALPMFGNDLDLGWRLARTGRECRVVPDATMFHVEAAHRGVREGRLAARPRRDERASALHTLMVNGPAAVLPWRMLRLLVGGLLRALGLLLVRAGGDARDEVAALARVYGHPGRILRGRRMRRRQATEPHRVVRPLLAPAWMPYRHGLDFVTDLSRALFAALRDAVGRDDSGAGRSLPRRLAGSVDTWVVLGALVVALVASRGLLTGAPLHGGGLLAAPDGVSHWWDTWSSGWHWIGAGSDAAGPAYLLPLSLVGSVLFAQPGWVVWLLFVLSVPLTLVGALRLFHRLVPGRWAALWGAATYALLPIVSGAVSQGRLGTVAGALLLPWVAAAALRLADPDPDRRHRATWRTALAAGLVVTFVPLALAWWWLVLLGRAVLGARGGARQAVVLALVPVAFLLPWLPELVASPTGFLVEAGRPSAISVLPDVWQVIAASSGGPGSTPFWLTLGIPLAGLVALLRRDTRSRVLGCWLVAVGAAVLLAVVSRVTVSLPGVPEPFRAWPGFWLVAVAGALVTAAVIAADGAVQAASRSSFGWRQLVGTVAVLAGLMAPIGVSVWWVWHGTADPLHRAQVGRLPVYLGELADTHHDAATLVLTGGPGTGRTRAVEYQVMRSDSLRLGDDAVLSMTAPDPRLHALVARLVTTNASRAADGLAAYGVAYVYAPAPVSPELSGALDASDGFAVASAPEPHTRAWRVVPRPSTRALDPHGPWWRGLLAAGQALALAGSVVMALPTRLLRGAR